jgi:hypothetical protein
MQMTIRLIWTPTSARSHEVREMANNVTGYRRLVEQCNEDVTWISANDIRIALPGKRIGGPRCLVSSGDTAS